MRNLLRPDTPTPSGAVSSESLIASAVSYRFFRRHARELPAVGAGVHRAGPANVDALAKCSIFLDVFRRIYWFVKETSSAMPLHDHFHEPLALRRHWTAFHNAWATYISEDINERLPPGYFAEANVQFSIEIDVATWQEANGLPSAEAWRPAAPQLVVPFALTADIVEVLVYHNQGGPVLAGAVELASPSNKDRQESRTAFVSKCAAYLYQGVGLVVVDVVTERRANLHQQLLALVSPETTEIAQSDLYTAGYRPLGHDGTAQLEIWHEALAIGQVLPTVPLWLRGLGPLPLDLEATYERTIQKQRVLVNGGSGR